jgi:RNA polymerase sigma-70 factor, ECF subfamily
MDVHPMELPVTDLREDDDLAGLVKRARAGGVGAFDTLASRVRDRVQRWARRLTHDEDDAEDIAQLVLLRLHARVAEFDGRSRFTTWLYTITRNVALSRRLTEARRSEILSKTPPPTADDANEAELVEDDTAARLATLIHRYFEQLPPRQREVFELCDVRGQNSTEIAARLGIAPSTVRGLLLKARRTIRLRMLEHHSRLLKEYET